MSGAEAFEAYIRKVNEQYRTGIAKEHAYRGALGELVNALLPQLLATNEPVHVACGAPDFAVCDRKTRQAVFYIEAKDVGDGDLDGRNVHREQFDRYRQGLPLVVFTDYLDFRFYRGETLVEKIRIAEEAEGRIRPLAENFARFAALLADFAASPPEKIKSPSRLAALMAAKARMLTLSAEKALRDSAEVQLGCLPPIRSLYDQVRQILIADTDEHEFADIFAQTVTYGLFAARLHDPTPDDFSREEAERLVPASNPFLKHLFHQIAENSQPEIEWNLADLVALFAATDIESVMRGYGKATGTEDPMVHFYEDFLAKYDAGLRKNRGVWYTPQPVVGFIVRAVDAILERDFKLEGGLANDEKIEIEVENEQYDGRRTSAKTLKRQVHKVQVLDPATGTATFLAAVVRLVHEKMSANAGLWPGYVADSLLPRLHGFEILMASYAMAHLKLDFLLSETGYTPLPGRRLNVFLTNSLEKYSENSLGPLFSTVIGQEAAAADYIKRDCPVMVVIGNPPYSGESQNKGAWIATLMEDFKKEPGGKEKLKERNPKWLNDDYVKFIRFAEHHIEKNGEGIVAFINPRGYLDNATFRGMRWHLLKTFNDIYTVDLHGDSKKQETAPDGSKDENVFDIMQGVSINIFVRRHAESAPSTKHQAPGTISLARVHHLDLFGIRQAKFDWLDTHSLDNAGFADITPTAPYYFFKPTDDTGREEYEKGFKLDELMPLNGMGIITKRDNLCIHQNACDALRAAKDIIELSQAEFYRKYKLPEDVRDWRYDWAKGDVVAHGTDSAMVKQVAYRIFDDQYAYYTGRARGFMGWPVGRVFDHFANGDNLGLCVVKLNSRGDDLPVLVTDKITDKTILSSKDNANVFPLWLYEKNSKTGDVTRKANFADAIYEKICAGLGGTTAGLSAAERFYRGHELGRSWYDIADVREILGLESVTVDRVDPSANRNAVKALFRTMAPVRNRADGRLVTFPIAAAKKLTYHRDLNIFGLATEFGRLFENARRAWSENAADIPSHRVHRNIDAYHQYVAKVSVAGEEFYVRFTVREDAGPTVRNELHGASVSRIRVYKAKDAGLSKLSRTQAEGPTSFVDSKIALFLSLVNVAEDAIDRVPPEQVFDYIYAVLHDAGYREKYREFLKVDFPRVPYPKDCATFERLSALGAELRELHLMKRHAPRFGTLAAFPIAGTNEVEGARWSEGRVWINDAQYFDGVDESVWTMKIGGYQPAQKWLKDRKGRRLTNEEIGHYRDIVFVLGETRRIVDAIRQTR